MKHVPKLIKGVQSFAITKAGICLNYKDKSSRLVTDELTAYAFVKSRGEIKNQNDWWTIENLGYQVDNFYSLNFILELVKQLRKSSAKEVLQKI